MDFLRLTIIRMAPIWQSITLQFSKFAKAKIDHHSMTLGERWLPCLQTSFKVIFLRHLLKSWPLYLKTALNLHFWCLGHGKGFQTSFKVSPSKWQRPLDWWLNCRILPASSFKVRFCLATQTEKISFWDIWHEILVSVFKRTFNINTGKRLVKTAQPTKYPH